MDFFEKAHVVKKDSLRKETKSEEAVKKQLKQMLYGYKHSDSKLINSCNDAYDPSKFNDDSSSVSGFSDLNLTNSSIEATCDVVESNDDNDSVSDVDEQSLNKISNTTNTDSNSYDKSGDISDQPEDMSDQFEGISEQSESISDNDDKLQRVSDNVRLEDLTLDSHSDVSDNEGISNSSFIDTPSEIDTNDSEFDPDGELAMKILEKLGKKVDSSKKGVKRKMETQDVTPDSNENGKQNIKDKKKTIKNKNESTLSSPVVPEDVNKDISENTISADDSNSSAFISIVAAEMPNQSLSDIIGDYKHPTIKNLPSDVQNISTNNSGIFSIEDCNVEDIDLIDDGSSSDFIDTVEGLSATDIDTNVESYNESSEINDTTVRSEETSEIEDTEIFNESVNSVCVYYGKNTCIFVMKHPTEIYIHGKVKIKSLGGTIELFGYTLQDKPCEIYAPNYNLAHCIKTVEKENLNDGLYSKLLSEGLKVSEAEEILADLDQYDGVISLRKLNNHKMDFVENNMQGTDLFSKISKNVDNFFKKASEILKCSLYSLQPYKAFEEGTSWGQAIECGLKDKSRGIICGGKGVGKSTTLRYFVNQLLSRGPVLVIDLDPGQAEFTVAGNISATIVDKPLLGPNFTHLKTPEMMLNLGMINTMDNPRRYAAAVGVLINYCYNNERLHAMPWIINTMGMCNNMGLKFMTLIVLHTRPTYLLQIESKNPKKSFELYLDCHATRKLYEEHYKKDFLFRDIHPEGMDYLFFTANRSDKPGKSDFSLPTRDERYLNFLAYFGALITSQNRNDVLGVVPYEVKLDDLNIGLNVKILQDAIPKVINGKIVALCQLNTRNNDDKVFTLRDKAILCLGHGFIRGVDLERQMVYIITPMAVDMLSQVNTLVYADWVPELRGQESQLPHGISVPYRTASIYQQRQLMFAPRRRFNPLQLLKMSRNS